MKLKITNKFKDYMLFVKELRQNKKDFNFLFKSMFGFYSLFAVLIYMFMNVGLCYNPYYYPTMPEFLIITFVVFGLYFLFQYKSDIFMALSNIKVFKPDYLFLGESYIEFKSPYYMSFFKFIGVEKFYETESFFAVPWGFSGITELIIVKKDDLNSDAIKNKLVTLNKVYFEQEKSKKEKIFGYILKYIVALISILFVIDTTLFFVHYPMDRNHHNQIFISKLNFLYVTNDSEYWALGLRPYDIPISINGENVVNIPAQLLEQRLKGKNIKLKVLKRDTGEFVEYTINK